MEEIALLFPRAKKETCERRSDEIVIWMGGRLR